MCVCGVFVCYVSVSQYVGACACLSVCIHDRGERRAEATKLIVSMVTPLLTL